MEVSCFWRCSLFEFSSPVVAFFSLCPHRYIFSLSWHQQLYLQIFRNCLDFDSNMFCRNKTIKLLHKFSGNSIFVLRKVSRSTVSLSEKSEDPSIGGLAKALGKFRDLEKSAGMETPPVIEDNKNFLTLLRQSEFVQMGDPKGKVVIGNIFQVVNTDLYIDFGGKFYCVCRKPKRNSELFVRNAKVKIRINELELCARFLGATEDLTLTEASGTLLDLVWSPFNKGSRETSTS